MAIVQDGCNKPQLPSVNKGANVLFVSDRYGNNAKERAQNKYKYFQGAIDAVTDNSHIVLFDGDYDGDYVVDGKTGLTISSYISPNAGRPVNLTGNFTVRNSSNFRLEGVRWPNSTSVVTFEAQPETIIDNITSLGQMNISGSGYFRVSGSRIANYRVSGNVDFHITDSAGEATGVWVSDADSLRTTIERCSHLSQVQHLGGQLYGLDVELSWDITPFPLVSTANTGYINLAGGSSRSESGVLQQISKTGTCSYNFRQFDYARNSAINGTEITSPQSQYYTADEVDALIVTGGGGASITWASLTGSPTDSGALVAELNKYLPLTGGTITNDLYIDKDLILNYHTASEAPVAIYGVDSQGSQFNLISLRVYDVTRVLLNQLEVGSKSIQFNANSISVPTVDLPSGLDFDAIYNAGVESPTKAQFVLHNWLVNNYYTKQETDAAIAAAGGGGVGNYLPLTAGSSSPLTGSLYTQGLVPTGTGYNVGTLNTPYSRIYVSNVYTANVGTEDITSNTGTITSLESDTITAGEVNGVNLLSTGSGVLFLSDDGTYKTVPGGGGSGNYLPLTGGSLTGDLGVQNVIPTTTNTYTLGSLQFQFEETFSNQLFTSQISNFSIDPILIGSSIIPSDSNISLGNETSRFATIWTSLLTTVNLQANDINTTGLTATGSSVLNNINATNVTVAGLLNGVSITSTGDGESYLSNDGSYKTIQAPDLSGYVTLDTQQEVQGVKSFSQHINVGNIYPTQSTSQIGSVSGQFNDAYIRNITAQLVNGVSLLSTGDGNSYLTNDGTYKPLNIPSDVIVTSSLPVTGAENTLYLFKLDNPLSYTPYIWNGTGYDQADLGTGSGTVDLSNYYNKAEVDALISGIDPVDGDYLPLSGGTLTGQLTSQNISPSTSGLYTLGAVGAEYYNVLTQRVTASEFLRTLGSVFADNSINVGLNKSSYQDGVSGVSIIDGAMHMTAASVPFISFYSQNATSPSSSLYGTTGLIYTQDSVAIGGESSNNKQLYVTGASTLEGQTNISGPLFVGSTTKNSVSDSIAGTTIAEGVVSLQSASAPSLQFYTGTASAPSGVLRMTSGVSAIRSTVSVSPDVTNSLTLGTTSLRWGNILSRSGDFSADVTAQTFNGVELTTGGDPYAVLTEEGVYSASFLPLDGAKEMKGSILFDEAGMYDLASLNNFLGNAYAHTIYADTITSLTGGNIGVATGNTGVFAYNGVEVATLNEGIVFLGTKYFTPVESGTDFVLSGITFDEIQEAFEKYSGGAKTIGTNKNGFINVSVDNFIVDEALVNFRYRFALADFDSENVSVYSAFISGTEGGILTRVTLIHSYSLPGDDRNRAVYGDISTSTSDPLDLAVGDSGLIFRAVYSSATASRLQLLTATGTIVADVRRASIYGGSSEGAQFDGATWTTTPVDVDDTVLSQSNDTMVVTIAIEERVWECRAFISGAGARARLWYTKLI